jgi:hypothetical protein
VGDSVSTPDASFGDADALGPNCELGRVKVAETAFDFTTQGLPLIAFRTGEDNDMPVELAASTRPWAFE